MNDYRHAGVAFQVPYTHCLVIGAGVQEVAMRLHWISLPSSRLWMTGKKVSHESPSSQPFSVLTVKTLA